MEKERESFAGLVRRLRSDRSLSLRQLEAETGISNGYLSQVESGQVGAPSAKVIQRLSTALDFPYIEMMKAAGYLNTELPEAPYLHLGDHTLPLDELTNKDRAELIKFVEHLKKRRNR